MSQAYRAQSIPSLPPKLDPQLRQFLASVKELLEVRTAQRGNPQDTAVTFRDLVDTGILSLKDGVSIGGRSYTRDELLGLVQFNLPNWITSDTAPPPPGNLQVRARITVVDLSWDASTFDSYDKTEIWRADANDLSKAALVGSTSGATYVDSLPEAGKVFYYWIRDVSRAGLQSPFNDVNGALTVAGPSAPTVTTGIMGPDYVLSWTATASNLLVSHYLIEYETATGWQTVASSASTVYRAKVQWLGQRKFRIRGVDVQGNLGTPTVLTITITGPGSLTVDRSFVAGSVRLSWAEPTGGSLPVAGYRIYVQGNTVPVLQAEQLSTTYQVAVTWAQRTFLVSAVDSAGNEGARVTIEANVLPPSAPSVTVGFSSGNSILRWTLPTGGTLPVARYRVYEGQASPSALLSDQLSTIYTTAVTWSSRTFFVSAVDTAGNEGAASQVPVSILAPQNVTLQAAFDGENVRLTWSATSGSLPVAYFNLRHGASYAAGVPVMGIQGTSHTVRADWTGSRTFWVAAVDSSGTVSESASVAVQVGLPTAPALRHEFSGVQSVLSWNPVSSSLPLAGYEIRYGDTFASGSFMERVQATGLATPVTWMGVRTFWVAAYDSLGNYGGATSFAVDVTAPSSPTISTSFAGPDVVLRWTASASSLPLAEYEIRYGSTFATASTVGRVKGTVYTRRVDWVGQRQFWVVGIDQLGNMGAAGGTTLEIKTAAAPNLTTEVIDNNVLLRWNAVQGTLPTDTYEIRKGASWETGTGLGTKAGEFTTIFETVGGSYTYWLAAVDTAGNYGTPARAAATVAQPPDYVLAANWRSTFDGTKANAALDLNGSLLLPVNTSQTWESHFTSRGWASPQAQINAGYPIFAQPGATTGYYEEVRDYGTTLAAMKVTVEYVLTTLAGTLSDSVTITTALDAGFTQGVQTLNAKQAYAVNFRYVRVRVTVTGTNDQAVGNMSGLTIKLDAKLKTLSGTLSCSASDAGGTIFYLTDDRTANGPRTFIDVDAIVVTPLGTSAQIAVCDFLDQPSPTSMKVLLFNTSGARINGTASCTIRGY